MEEILDHLLSGGSIVRENETPMVLSGFSLKAIGSDKEIPVSINDLKSYSIYETGLYDEIRRLKQEICRLKAEKRNTIYT